MSNKNITALVSCFLRAYHYKNSITSVFRDELAVKLLDKDYDEIAENLSNGIKFFEPDFQGSKAYALDRIVDHYLAPAVVARSAFCEDALFVEKGLGCRQYLIFGAGYDTYAYRNWHDNVNVLEIDKEEMILDKKRRVEAARLSTSKARYISCDLEKQGWTDAILNSDYDCNQTAFCSLMGITQYISKDSFAELLDSISSLVVSGSGIVFDYVEYSYRELEALLSEKGFRIYEYLDTQQITDRYFELHNKLFPENRITVGASAAFCLAVKK